MIDIFRRRFQYYISISSPLNEHKILNSLNIIIIIRLFIYILLISLHSAGPSVYPSYVISFRPACPSILQSAQSSHRAHVI